MADELTSRTLRRRKRIKIFVLGTIGFSLGLILEQLFSYVPVPHLLSIYFRNLVPDPDSWIKRWPEIKLLAAPIAGLGVFVRLSQKPWFRKLVLDRYFPDPPPFVHGSLEQARRDTMRNMERPPLPFVGRDEEIKQLKAVASKEGAAFCWQTLIGPSGIGKTRLVIEWLEHCKGKGWDVGIIDPDDLKIIKGWRARRPTALVIDQDAARWINRPEDVLLNLSEGARQGREVRVLVVDQSQPSISMKDPAHLKRVTDAQVTPPLRLPRLDETSLEALQLAAGCNRFDLSTLYHETNGNPMAALIMFEFENAKTYIEARSQMADRFMPMLQEGSHSVNLNVVMPIALAVLAGPVPTKTAERLCSNVDSTELERYFDEKDRKDLRHTLPGLGPRFLAQELLLRAIPHFDGTRLALLIDTALDTNPDSVERMLGSFWRDRPDLRNSHDKNKSCANEIALMQERFDTKFPDRVEELRKRAKTYSDEISQENIELQRLPQALAQLEDLANSRPFDREIQLSKAFGTFSAIGHYGGAQQWDDLERWGRCLVAIAEDTRFGSDPEIRIKEAQGAVSAMWRYGSARRWDDFERWGRYLSAIAEDTRFESDREIRLEEAQGAVNAISSYNGVNADDSDGWVDLERWDDLERWGRLLSAIAEDTRFGSDREIRLKEAQGAANAMGGYGLAKRWDDLERWGRCLVAIAEDTRFESDPEIRLKEAQGAVNAMGGYGRAKRWDDLERWGRCLVAVAEDTRFENDREIRLHGAGGAYNAISSYGRANRFDDVERWARRLVAVAEDTRFESDPEIRLEEAKAAVHVMIMHGNGKRWDDLERWGRRLVAVTEDTRFESDPKIRLMEAYSASNSMFYYGKEGRWNDLESWGRRLVAVVEDTRFLSDPAIRAVEAQGAVNALTSYVHIGDAGYAAYDRWFKRLAHVASRFPHVAKVQELAANFGLTYVEQCLKARKSAKHFKL